MEISKYIAQNVNIKNKEYTKYSVILENTTEHLTKNFSEIILDLFEKNSNVKEKLFIETEKYLSDNALNCKDILQKELIQKIYTDSFEFSFLNKYIFNEKVEEINGNSWDCIIVNYSNGKSEIIEEKFQNKEQAISIIKRILRISNTTIDNVSPTALGDIGKNRRITAMMSPIIDEEIGVTFSIRNINSSKITRDTFTIGGTATEEMLNFLSEIIRYKVSICFAGSTGSGKTALLNWLLGTLPDSIRIMTIESGSNELDLIKKDEKGNIINNIIHTKTKENKNNRQYEITQDNLLALALRYHPDLIAVGEMRDKEAYTSQEASNTGHTVLSTTHSSNSRDTYDRILTLSLKADVKVDDKKLYKNIIKGFPIIVYVKQLEDKSRKVMDILETYIDEEDKIVHNSIFLYEIEEVEYKNDETIIKGKHIKSNTISKSFEKRLRENGMPTKLINKLKGGIKK